MKIIVSKFGGSSVADADKFKRVRALLRANPDRRYIVLSAPGRRWPDDEKVTDLLCRAHQMYQQGGNGDEPLKQVQARFVEIIRHLHLDFDPDRLFAALRMDVLQSSDRAASRGEFLCAKLFAEYAGLPFVDAANLIHFDENGRLLYEETRQSFQKIAKELPYAIIPGFYGSLPNGEIKVFSRGGSDISGALAAAGVDADLYENWTDVDGLMSVDPALCCTAVSHAAIGYQQMRTLAQAGAQVLHPDCLAPVCEAGIPTILKNTFAPEKPGTFISDNVHDLVPCVCAKDGFVAIETHLLPSEYSHGIDQCYRTVDGHTLVALRPQANLAGIEVSIVSAFGLSRQHYEDAIHRICPIAFLQTEKCLRLLVAPSLKTSALLLLHSLLMQ